MEHEIWFTALLNGFLAAPVAGFLAAIGYAPADPAHPIPDYIAMEILVILVILAGVLILRRGLSVENPGKFQHVMEEVLGFVRGTADEIIGHGASQYVPMLGTLFIFVAACNLLSLFPTLAVPDSKLHIEVSPTGLIQTTLGCALAVFLYYNYHGLRQHGVIGYLKHLCGPSVSRLILLQLLMALLMFPIELVGNLGRLLSLSVRLYANMLVGGILERVFGGLVPIAVPVVFMALHIFVSLLQAYIFLLLPAIYISMAVAEEH